MKVPIPAGRMLGALLKARGETVAVSESAAGGLVSTALLAVPGASAWFVGGGVVYTRAARQAVLGMSEEEAKQRGATEDYALAAARAIRARTGATWGLAESGASGPSGNRYGDAAGHACFAVAGPVEKTLTIETGKSDREDNMRLFAEAALALLQDVVRDADQPAAG
ncbi:MAG: CinA family protein [Acetobacterales bacterium]